MAQAKAALTKNIKFDKERNKISSFTHVLLLFLYDDIDDVNNVDDDDINNDVDDDVDDDVGYDDVDDDEEDVEDDYYLHVSQLMLLPTLTSPPRRSKFKYREFFRLYRRT